MKGYLATHFFNEAGFEWTAKIAKQIREGTGIDLYVPQENDEINDKSSNDGDITAIAIAEGDNKYLEAANILIVNLDGVEIDAGAASEIGYFAGLRKAELQHTVMPKHRMIIGLYTDMRQDGTGDNHYYINLYTKGLVELHGKVVRTVDEVIDIINNLK